MVMVNVTASGGFNPSPSNIRTGPPVASSRSIERADIVVPDAREYDREFTKVHSGRARIRVGFSTAGGDVTRFVVQLEHRLGDDWAAVVRFDYDPEGELGHDVTSDGVHTDVYRGGEKLRTETVFPPMPPGAALTTAEEHLSEQAEPYLERHRRWHGTDDESR